MSKHEMLHIDSGKKMAFDKTRWRVFGDWLKAAREERNLSQDGLGDAIGKDRQTIYRLENALTGTKRETVIALAKALKKDVNEALTKSGFAPQTVAESFEILDGVTVSFDKKKMPKIEQDKILELMRTVAAGVKAQKEEKE